VPAARDALGQATARLLVDPVLALVFPSPCPGCGGSVDHPTAARCAPTAGRHCRGMAGCSASAGSRFPRGSKGRAAAAAAASALHARASLGPYEGTLRVLVHELKFRGRRRVAGRLAEMLLDSPDVRAVLAATARAGVPVMVPVPLHPSRLRERGFNQSALLAQALADRHALRWSRVP